MEGWKRGKILLSWKKISFTTEIAFDACTVFGSKEDAREQIFAFKQR
jgi:hypothetical protein